MVDRDPSRPHFGFISITLGAILDGGTTLPQTTKRNEEYVRPFCAPQGHLRGPAECAKRLNTARPLRAPAVLDLALVSPVSLMSNLIELLRPSPIPPGLGGNSLVPPFCSHVFLLLFFASLL